MEQNQSSQSGESEWNEAGEGEKWEEVSAEVWKPVNPGDELVGIFKGRESNPKYGNWNYTMKTDKGLRTVFGTTVLDRFMLDCDDGDTVKIVFHGTRSMDNGHSVKLFKVFKKKSPKPAPYNAPQVKDDDLPF